MKIISLLYHDVVQIGHESESGFNGPGPDKYKLSLESFKEQINYLSDLQCFLVTDLNQVGDTKNGFMLTFDDGGVSAIKYIAPLLEERNFRGHFFITSDYIGRPGFLDEVQIKELAVRGHTIGSHSATHPRRMSYCSREKLISEWETSVKRLSEILNSPCTIASVPGGYYLPRVAEAASASGIKILFTSEPTTAVAQVESCRVYGRFSVVRGDTGEKVSKLARGDFFQCGKQKLWWESKKVLKKFGGNYYLKLRHLILSKWASRKDSA